MNVEEALKHISAAFKEGAGPADAGRAGVRPGIVEAAQAMEACLRAGGKLLFFGNGGSAADAQHIAAEFVGHFINERRALAAIALTTDTSILTAVGNDYALSACFRGRSRRWERPGTWPLGSARAGIHRT